MGWRRWRRGVRRWPPDLRSRHRPRSPRIGSTARPRSTEPTGVLVRQSRVQRREYRPPPPSSPPQPPVTKRTRPMRFTGFRSYRRGGRCWPDGRSGGDGAEPVAGGIGQPRMSMPHKMFPARHQPTTPRQVSPSYFSRRSEPPGRRASTCSAVSAASSRSCATVSIDGSRRWSRTPSVLAKLSTPTPISGPRHAQCQQNSARPAMSPICSSRGLRRRCFMIRSKS